MKTKMVVCPTLRFAFYEWHRLADTYSDMWADICRKPMSLTSKMGTKYIFCSENETDKLKGFHGDFIRWDKVEPQKSEGEQMSDIEIIIKMPEEMYKWVNDANKIFNDYGTSDFINLVKSGTSLPEGHGRILDEKDILDIENNDGGWYDLVDMPEYIAGIKAIIEADRAESEG